ncbi:diguanylate cyclase domain-containing protein [Bosea sp. 2RAB26]|uniref:GGDEF domain-containing protein n=1 Tax=Bosea sp. 2RAB26 TaxID=3237476 RepID=UPI003F903639
MSALEQVIDAAENAPPAPARDSSYARQRARGFKRLRFVSGLEDEYRRYMRIEQRMSTLVCALTALGIWLVFIALDIARIDPLTEYRAQRYDALAAAALRWITLAVLLSLISVLVGKRLPRAYNRLSFLVLVLIGTTSAVSANVFKLRGLAQADLAGFVIIMAVFLPVGLTFHQSVAAAMLIAVLNALLGFVMLDPGHIHEHIRISILMFFAVFVGAVGAYLREYTQRDHFLLRRMLHNRAMSDALTGIGNRRFFEEHAATALRQARRERAGLVFAILDVDHFKKYNDRYGHQAGDLALRSLARALEARLRRPMDMVGRLGGEEFGLILYGVRPDTACAMLDNLVRAVSSLDIPHDASDTAPHLTASVGAALFDGLETLEQIYRRADGLLYVSKAKGRDRFTLG